MRRWWLAGSLLVMVAIGGCSGGAADGPKTAKAGGLVTLNGQPVEGATVSFSPQGPGRAAVGKTNAEGRFQLATTNNIGGVVPGTYQVGITKQRIEGGMTPEESQAYYEKTGQPPPAPKVFQELPEKYGNPATSELQATVSEKGPNDFPFELKR